MSYSHVSLYPFFSSTIKSIHNMLMIVMEYILWHMLVSETIIRKNVNKLITYFNVSYSNCKSSVSKITPIIMVIKRGKIIMVINSETYGKALPDYDLVLKLSSDSSMIVTDNIEHIPSDYNKLNVAILSVTLDICGSEHDITPISGTPDIFIQGNKIYSPTHIKFICNERGISEYEFDKSYKVTVIDSDINSYIFENEGDEKSHILVDSDKLIIHNNIKK